MHSGDVFPHNGQSKDLHFRDPKSVDFLLKNNWLVVSTHPIEKYARQLGNLPQVGLKIKKYLIWNHHPDNETSY